MPNFILSESLQENSEFLVQTPCMYYHPPCGLVIPMSVLLGDKELVEIFLTTSVTY